MDHKFYSERMNRRNTKSFKYRVITLGHSRNINNTLLYYTQLPPGEQNRKCRTCTIHCSRIRIDTAQLSRLSKQLDTNIWWWEKTRHVVVVVVTVDCIKGEQYIADTGTELDCTTLHGDDDDDDDSFDNQTHSNISEALDIIRYQNTTIRTSKQCNFKNRIQLKA